MSNEGNVLIANSNSFETRIGLLQNDKLVELFIERDNTHSLVGNIYKGTVSRVLPGMNAAFVNIGEHKSAFLFGGDVVNRNISIEPRDPNTLGRCEDNPKPNETKPIEKTIKDGDQVLVQVSKDTLGTKGPRITMQITIPGQYLVLMPYNSQINISRRIEDEDERKRLEKIVSSCLPPHVGAIVRTAAENTPEEHIEHDIEYLQGVWHQLKNTLDHAQSPELIYKDLHIAKRMIRDLFSLNINKVIVDDLDSYKEIKSFVTYTPSENNIDVEYYDSDTPIFDHYKIEQALSEALSRRVNLKSGGYLIIEQTEALTSFDVNTGRYVGKGNARDTILKTNLEAIKSIVDQLRLRNIGGIIVLDFIDMESGEHKERVYNALMEELKNDRARTNVLRVSDVGLVQMTRKRTSDSLSRKLTTSCPHCHGTSMVKTVETLAMETLRKIDHHCRQTKQKKIHVQLRDDIHNWIQNNVLDLLNRIIKRNEIEIVFEPSHAIIEAIQTPPFKIGSLDGV